MSCNLHQCYVSYKLFLLCAQFAPTIRRREHVPTVPAPIRGSQNATLVGGCNAAAESDVSGKLREMHVATRRDFLHKTTAAGAGLALASADLLHAVEEPGHTDKLTDADGKYAAAPLPFAYDALEPVVDARTVELHYAFHHKPAAVAANKAEDALAKAGESNDFGLVKHYEKELAFQLSSHILHTVYRTSVSGKGGEPKGELAKAIDKDFGSYAKLKAQLVAATVAVEASGWGIVGYLPATGKLMVLQCGNHQKLTAWGIQPILALDVFEHAYYLKYQNRRNEYVNQVFNLMNWDNAAMRLRAALPARRAT
jgi:superoxide dismutase, Fe-Mn family